MTCSTKLQITIACLILAAAGHTCLAQSARVPMHSVPSAAPNPTQAHYATNSASTTKQGKYCWLFPTRPSCLTHGADPISSINSFYGTASTMSYFSQIKSIYNGASGSTTVSADLTSLNFAMGMQLTAATNIQAGSSSPTTVSSGTTPTLSSTSAGQATQNLLYGGSFLVSTLYPVLAIGCDKLASAGGFGTMVDLIAKEGIDIQNFTSGSSISVTAPPSHTSAGIEGYLQYNSTNSTTSTSSNAGGIFAGAVFVGGSYGYSYMSHDYARNYGFGTNVNNAIAQLSAGILINNVAKIAVSRAFGPSQKYIDSTTLLPVTVNNFKSWSIGITYQSAPAK